MHSLDSRLFPGLRRFSSIVPSNIARNDKEACSTHDGVPKQSTFGEAGVQMINLS